MRAEPNRKRSIALQQVSIGDYRRAVLDLIYERCRGDVRDLVRA